MNSFSVLFSKFSWPIFFTASLTLLLVVVYLYWQRIRQLSNQNRLLRALRAMDDVVLSTTDIKLLCQKMVDVIHKELGYAFAVIALVDNEAKVIKRVAISLDQSSKELLSKIISVQFEEQVVPFSETRNLFNRVIAERKEIYTDNLYDIQVGVMPEEDSRRIQDTFKLKTAISYPIIAQGKVIGILEYASIIKNSDISEIERSIMTQFSFEVSRALENAFLYQDLKTATEELEQANLKLKQLDKLKDDFVSIASHELRTPMTAIRSYAWMALYRSGTELSDKMKRYLSRTLVSTERLINLVNDMLNISRIESGSIPISPIPFDIISLTKDVCLEVVAKAKEKNIRLEVIETHVPKVFADADKVHQILLNLIGNAMKFTPEHGSINMSFFSDGETVEISVKDTGVGISQDDISRLFQKFGRLDNSYVATATSGGTGLGLYISKILVGLMQGKIWVKSEGRGHGTTFSFSLPAAIPKNLEHPEKYSRQAAGEAKSLEPAAV